MYGGRRIRAVHTALAVANPPRSRPPAYVLPRDAGPWRQRDCDPTRDPRLGGARAAPSPLCELERGPEVFNSG
jgi:hypothetical protein